MPSLPATDDGSARPLAEDLSTDSGGSHDSTWDADMRPVTADAAATPEAGGTDGGPRTTETEPRAAGQQGIITLTASHPLLGQAEVPVRSEKPEQANEL